jgi:POT family proton-dependent oligopeptide transporter
LQFVGFYLAYTLPTVVFLLCPLVLWFGRNRYNRSPPTGSVLSTALRLWFRAARGRWSLNPIKTYRNMQADDFWENVKPSNIKVEDRPAWMNFDDAWVDELQRGFKACAVFLWIPLYCEYLLNCAPNLQ